MGSKGVMRTAGSPKTEFDFDDVSRNVRGGYSVGEVDVFGVRERVDRIQQQLNQLEANILDVSEATLRNRLKRLDDIERGAFRTATTYFDGYEPDRMSQNQGAEYDALDSLMTATRVRIRDVRVKLQRALSDFDDTDNRRRY